MWQIGRWVRGRWPWWALLGAVLLVVALPAWPGRLNYDTDDMLGEARDVRFTDFHAPVLLMLYRPVVVLVGITPVPIYVGQVAVLVLSVGAILRAAGLSRRAAIVTTFVLMVTPLFVSAEISVTRDTWYVALLLAMTAIAVHPTLVARWRWLALGLLAFLNVAARQNAFTVVVVVLCWRLWVDLPRGRRGALRPRLHRARRGVVAAAGACLATVALVGLVAGARLVGGARPAGPEAVLYFVDLDELSTRQGQELIPRSAWYEQMTLEYMAQTSLYSLDKTFYIDRRAPLKQAPPARAELRQAWLESILEWPGEYLRVRWKMFTRQIGWSGPTVQTYLPETGTSYSSPFPTFAGPSGAVSRYLSWFNRGGHFWESGPIHRPWPWLAAAWVVAAIRRKTVHTLLAVMATAHLAGLFFLAPVVLYRLVQPQVLLCLLSVALALAQAAAWPAGRRNARQIAGYEAYSSASST